VDVSNETSAGRAATSSRSTCHRPFVPIAARL
jgi:hypothetical protein